MDQQSPKKYSKLKPSLMWQLAGPQTWAAALTPVLLSYIYCAVTYSGNLNLLLALILLVICILMQSAVNVFDDYFDYRKGTDTLDNSSEDAFDAVLVYNNVNPKSVLALAIAYLAIAGLLGFYLVAITGWELLVIGVIGAIVVVIYSAGKTPISHLPIGEFASGFVMGALIPLACNYVLSGVLDFWILVIAIPQIIGIGMILFTNNTCDIEKDQVADRKTVSVLLGRGKAEQAYRVWVYLWLLSIVLIGGILYSPGSLMLLIMLISAYPTLRALLNNPLNQQSRTAAMSQVTMLNIILTVFYGLSIACGSFLTWF